MSPSRVSLAFAALLIGAGLSAGTGRLAAAPGDEQPPDPPLYTSPAPPCAWTIDVVQKHPRPAPPDDPQKAATYKRMLAASPRLTRVTVEKAGGNLHREMELEDGRMDVLWIYDGWVIFKPANVGAGQATAMRANNHLSPVKGGPGPDFPDLAWVKSAAFVKTVTYHGQRCHYYEDKVAPALTGGDVLSPNPLKGERAWIDASTRLPVAVEDDAVLKKFNFAKDAPERLVLSGASASAYEKAAKASAADKGSSADE